MFHNGKELTLQEFIEEKKKVYLSRKPNGDWKESEEYIWAFQDYLSSCGEFSEEERNWLKETDPEILALDEEV